ncbi:MAG: 4-hydroxythreonine-4-phosphate dehydrogenase PdxA [Deltaproteobacteria bacterium]|nr:4-hydroxythreonine-4-phosphate dehydrogenase PdxA [Deltaproteobacteria bacterium]
MARTRELPWVAISLGDPSGIGPEVTARALARPDIRRRLRPVVFGDTRVWGRACRAAGVRDGLAHVQPSEPWPERGVLVEVTQLAARESKPGRPDLAGARAQLAFLQAATDAVADGRCRALCTAPLSKAQVNAAGVAFTGHTEYLANRFKRRVLMMLAGQRLRVVLATTHLPLREVPDALSTARLTDDLALIRDELRRLGLRRPRIAVCGLNPHAGESGHLGKEDARIIAPAIARARRRGIRAEGPFPADSLFPRAVDGGFDAVFAMFHDQGLVALKLLHFRDGVNVTLGLPFVRTSPDHGTAYDLAGTGRADDLSMAEALRWAARYG